MIGSFPWWAWGALVYVWIGVKLTEDAYMDDKEGFDADPTWAWVVGALFGVLLWPVVWWLGRRG